MKKVFTLLLAVATSLAAFADLPLLVGHRGSQYGVENTVESFTNGAKMGYDYLETDWKLTKDLQFVCSHDDDISRLASDGSKATIAGNTLAELQSHPLAQTRSGVKYTGRLCSAQEYLDVCKQYDKKPLIELKWTTGINSNDCSNIPKLIKFIEDNGFRNKCIILTSMKPCLEYIRKNYPDIELQFLTGQYWESHFDWCVNLGIDVDIQSGYFDKSTVNKYHNKGLKVNMWTTNTNDGYKQYGNWGCDFITTDYLDPQKLPELDASVTLPANTVDYPETEGNVSSTYETEPVAEFDIPSELSGRNIYKSLFRNGEWTILSFDANGADARIDCIDALTGKITGNYNIDGIADMGDIAMTADGILIACNTTTLPFNAPANPTALFNLYKWTDRNSAPVKFFTTDNANEMGNWSNSVCGKHIAVSGRFNDLYVYVSSWSASGQKTRLVGFKFSDGAMTQYAYNLDIEWTKDYTMTVTPTSRDCILVNNAGMDPTEYRYVWTTRANLEENAGLDNGTVDMAAQGISYYRLAAKVYAVLPDKAKTGGMTAKVYDVTRSIAQAQPVTTALHDGLGTSIAAHTNTAMATDSEGSLYVHLLSQDGGMASVKIVTDAISEGPVPVDLVLTRDWIYSVSTDNAPDHIDGTNAQQGTAVDGIFYINDRSEKKLHLFDSTGYLGAIPGGAGYGCTRDDAGNIIIRNENTTGTTMSFLVYPAGTTLENHSDPVAFDAVIDYPGETHFINASGDVLGATGHIYIYPNKQTAVNIISVSEGQATGCTSYIDLSMAGTTAGYVIPQNDDSENWLYQIRGTGIYQYNGGTSSAISVGNASTTAPARNSTTGAAYFKMQGNQILIHNSGTNYVGGFTVRNTTEDKVISNIEPIGNKGYSEGGNYSVSNWLIPEKVSDGVYNIYQYCPANGIAKYTLTDRNSAVLDITTDRDSNDTFTIYADHNTLSVGGIAVSTLRIYNVAGQLVASSNADTADISGLTPGMYIVKVNNNGTRKFMKK